MPEAARPAGTVPGAVRSPYADGVLYGEVERFYARQVHLLGEGDLDRWALTFTEDALFEQEAQAGRVWTGNAPSERRGRAAIVAAARGAVAARREAAAVRRYLIGMLDLAPAADGSVRTRYRAVLLQTPRGGTPEVYLSTTGQDVLVRQDGDWRVRHRINSHDNAPAGSAGAPTRKDHTHG
ncbi:nuclear transport factor 2 family protein [Streptomyces sp. NBC_01477]|uniref:nuclear transport factor 2 family protein n=2 Tax=unclassified Streptomyces TaxID=2593676 RepID=UPI002E35117E|nr:nuclear transport factor 2 family protein [Streptomyces sp. NBC_01477]